MSESPLKSLRESRGLSVVDLAARVGRSRIAVYEWERGGDRPTRENLANLLDTLEASEEERAAVLRWVSLPIPEPVEAS